MRRMVCGSARTTFGLQSKNVHMLLLLKRKLTTSLVTVTRTFPISGKYSPEAKGIYNLVEKMQEECIEMIKPGAVFLDIHLHAVEVATAGLIKLGFLVGGTYEEIYGSRAAVAFFPHGVSHATASKSQIKSLTTL